MAKKTAKQTQTVSEPAIPQGCRIDGFMGTGRNGKGAEYVPMFYAPQCKGVSARTALIIHDVLAPRPSLRQALQAELEKAGQSASTDKPKKRTDTVTANRDALRDAVRDGLLSFQQQAEILRNPDAPAVLDTLAGYVKAGQLTDAQAASLVA